MACTVFAVLTSGYSFASTPLEKAVKYWQSGYQKAQAGDHDGAIADYTKSIRADPTYEMVLCGVELQKGQRRAITMARELRDSTKRIQLDANNSRILSWH